MSCLSCHAETSNGLALCERCRIATSVDLEFLPVYFRNLARWRPGQAGRRRVPASREPFGVFPGRGDMVTDALDQAGNDITTWARCLADDRGVQIPAGADDEATTIVALCRLLLENLTSIATLDWAGEFVGAMQIHEAALRKLTERVAPGWYAGACRHCGVPTYVVHGLTWVTCGGCGATTYARDHIDTVIEEARGWVARPRPLAEAIVALVDTEMSVPRLYERIKKWEQRGKVTGIRRLDSDGDAVGPKRYRLGEVLNRLATEGETRGDEVDARAS